MKKQQFSDWRDEYEVGDEVLLLSGFARGFRGRVAGPRIPLSVPEGRLLVETPDYGRFWTHEGQIEHTDPILAAVRREMRRK